MILIIGSANDRVLTSFAYFLTQNSKSFLFADQNALGSTLFFYENSFLYNEIKISYKDLSGVYNRVVDTHKNLNEKTHRRYYALIELLNYLLDEELPNVVNRPSAANSNNSKPYQLSFCSNISLKIPPSTIIANSICNNSIKGMIFKSVSSIRSIVQELSEEYMDRSINCPVLFQKLIRGPNLRVHIIGNKIFALEIKSETVDYRYTEKPSKYQMVELPKHIQEDCLLINKRLGLNMSGIDLIKNENDDYYFLEANTSPAFNHFEEYMPSKNISAALQDFLMDRVNK